MPPGSECSWPRRRPCSAGLSAIASPPSPTASAISTRPSGSSAEGGATAFSNGVDHPLHPLGIAATHRLIGGPDPASWQRAALVLSFACVVLLVIPVYLLCLELFGAQSAWLACLLVTVNPIVDDIVVNVLSESTFLLWWTFGLWCGIRFLRDGRFLWLPPAICLGGLAYLTRPEGMLLPAALAAAVLISPALPRDPDRMAEVVARPGLHGGRAGDPGRTVHGDRRGESAPSRALLACSGWRPGPAPGPGARQTESRPANRPTGPISWRRSA